VKEAFRWSLGLLGKCLAKFEQAGRDRGELEYLRGLIGNSAAPESLWISHEYLYELRFQQTAKERELLSSVHAQAILIDELLRGYQNLPGSSELIVCRRDALQYLLSETSLRDRCLD
jgi:hypothetical protein